MTSITKVVLQAEDTAAAALFYKAFGVSEYVEVLSASEETAGFRGYTLSIICSQPANVDAFMAAALSAGAKTLKPAAKSFWGYGGAIEAPDGAVWTVAASSKKNTSPATHELEEVVLLLGVADVKASKDFYVDRGVPAGKSFGGKYAELETMPVKLALSPRRTAAKNAGVAVEGTGSHRLSVLGDAGAFTDLDGFDWVQR